MEKEFSNWAKDIKMKPAIGSKVRVKEGAPYNITVPGSEGIVQRIMDHNKIGVEFYQIGYRSRDNSYFTINKKDLEVIR